MSNMNSIQGLSRGHWQGGRLHLLLVHHMWCNTTQRQSSHATGEGTSPQVLSFQTLALKP